MSRSLAIVPTLFVAVVYQKSWELDVLNEALNVLQAIQIPFALIPVSTDLKWGRQSFRNSTIDTCLTFLECVSVVDQIHTEQGPCGKWLLDCFSESSPTLS